MKTSATQKNGFSPQLMYAAHILRMGAATLSEFLRQHNNPCLIASQPPAAPILDDDIRSLLHQRQHELPPPAHLHDIINELIECVEDNGLLDIPPAWQKDIPQTSLAAAIEYLQSVAPPGVAARNIEESLLLQLRQTPPTPARKIAEALIASDLPHLLRKRWDKIPQRKLTAAMPLLEKLSAAPGLAYQPLAAPTKPDVVFIKQRGFWRATAGDGLAITAAIRHSADATLSQRNEAHAVAAAIRSRRRWVLAAAQLAADWQAAFFTDGATALRPFSMREAAAELEVSAAFLSHIVNDKNAVFSGGGFPLKSLFPRRSVSQAGAAVEAIIKTMLKKENPHYPLSDTALCRMLRENGIIISRRTVHKRRQQAGIPPAHLRKQFLSQHNKGNSHAN